jgi:uncharacterized protein (TIRG00374 family)
MKAQGQFKRWGLGLAIFFIALVVLVPQVSELSRSWQTLQAAYWPYLLVAIVSLAWTYIAAAGVYVVISPKRLSFKQTLLVQIACGFSNRLVPAGAGALATNARYLMGQGYGKVQAGTIVAINNILGFAASFIVLITAGLLSGLDLINGIRLELFLSDRLLLAVLVITALVVAYAWVTQLPRKLFKLIRKINYQIEDSLLRSKRLASSLIMSIGVTIGYGLCFHFTAIALNVQLSVFQTFLVLTAGVLIASVTPTPGGVGGAEAGLVGVLHATGVDIHQAVTLALCYRLISYWLPIVPGYLVLNRLRGVKAL